MNDEKHNANKSKLPEALCAVARFLESLANGQLVLLLAVEAQPCPEKPESTHLNVTLLRHESVLNQSPETLNELVECVHGALKKMRNQIDTGTTQPKAK